MELVEMAKVLGGLRVLRMRLQNQMDLIELSNKGITKNALLHLAKYLCISTKQIADLLPVTEHTIRKYTPGQHFNRVVSEQILRIAEVAAKGQKTFGDKAKFLSWMNQQNRALANRTPMSLLLARDSRQE